MKNLFVFVLVSFLFMSAFADELVTQRASSIINRIEEDQTPNNVHLFLRSGLFQLTQNSFDSILVNENGIVPFVAVEGHANIIENFGLEFRFNYAQNFLFESSSVNDSGANQMSYDIGVRYTWVIDPTRTENYFGFKVMSHTAQNNYELIEDADESADPVYMKSYQALLMGLERSFYVTPIITVLASLDLLLIQDAQSDTVQDYEKAGLGFQVRGEAFLRLDLFGIPGRLGGAYWQGAYTNEFTNVNDVDVDSATTGKSRHVQSYRAVSVSYSLLF